VKSRQPSYFSSCLALVRPRVVGLRFFVQWLASEKAKAVVIPSPSGGFSISAESRRCSTLLILAWPILVGQGLNFSSMVATCILPEDEQGRAR